MFGITAKFMNEHIFAISGGIFDISLNDKPIKTNKAYIAKSGDVLSIKGAKQGLRCYLAVAGGFDVPLFMGSASTNLKINVGGFDGRKLKAGDVLKIGKADKIKNIEKRELPENTYNNIVKVRAVLGPQNDMFSENDLLLFSNQQYTVTSDLDRMGIRLWGIALQGKTGNHFRRNYLWFYTDYKFGDADYSYGRPPNNRRLCKNSNSNKCRFAKACSG